MTLRMQGTVEFGRDDYGSLDGDHRFVPHHDREDYRPLEAPTHRRPTRRVLVETVEYVHDADGSTTTREFSYPYVELTPVPPTAVQPLKPSGRYHAFPAPTVAEWPFAFESDASGVRLRTGPEAPAGRVVRRAQVDRPLEHGEGVFTETGRALSGPRLQRLPPRNPNAALLLAALIGFSRTL